MKKILILILLMSGCFILESYAQKVALKSNLLYDATATMNLGLEFGLARKWTLDVPVNYNPWKPDNGRRLRHWGIQPEIRYWFCERFNRTFQYRGLARLVFCEWEYAAKPLSGTSVWCGIFGRAFVDIEKTLEY